ncbi:MAG: molybdenum ABC transporter ATP-binding protein [Caulobacteraceae bacterium]
MSAGVEGRFAGALGGFRLDAAFHLEPTGITALSGPSGSGKTSLLRCIAGLTRLPGRLLVDGEVWQDERVFVAPHRRPVGVVFQEPSLLAHLSVRGNLDYGARRAKTSDLDETIELLGLAPLLGRATGALSGGERQRVALGRALVTRPRLLLMDEPLSSLDAGAKAEILPYLERLHRTLAIPVLYISHDAGEIARLADRVLLMDAGKVAPGKAVARGDLAALSAEMRDALALAALRAGLTP